MTRSYREILMVLITSAGKFIFMDWLNLKLQFILATMIGWSVYVYRSYKNDHEVLTRWGFRTDNFRSVLKRIQWFGVAALVGCVCIGLMRHTINLTWHIFPVLLSYPVWGTIQQFLCVGLVAGNLQQMRVNDITTIVMTSVLFALLHYPNLWLVGGTFLLAIIYAYTYLRERNLYVLGIFHGWLGAIFYYTVVGRDPFAEIFGGWMK